MSKHQFRTDSTAYGTVSVCVCGWRYAGSSHAENARACRAHVFAVHADDQDAKKRASRNASARRADASREWAAS